MSIHYEGSGKILKRTIISMLIIALFFSTSVLAESTESHGDLTIIFFPDSEIEVQIDGGTHQVTGSSDISSYMRGLSFTHIITEEGSNLHRMNSNMIINFGPQLALFLASLDLDIEAHLDNHNAEVSLLTAVPGIASVEGVIRMNLEEDTYHGVLETELSATLWYMFFPKEQIEMMLENALSLKAEFESQVTELSGARLEVVEFILDSEVGSISTLVTLRVVLSGDWREGFMEIADNVASDYMDESFLDTEFSPDVLVSLRSSDVHITFDSEEFALNIEAETILEGEIDDQANRIKDEICEKVLEEGDVDDDTREAIEEFILPTELKISRLNASVTMSQENGTSIEFYASGIGLAPPSTALLLEYLEKASEEMDYAEFTLNLVGASSNGEYVEIIVPDSTSDPLLGEPSRVSWEFANLEDMDQIKIQVTEREQESETSDQGPGSLLPAVVGAVVIGAVAFYFLKKK